MIAGTVEPVYKFDHGVLQDDDVEMGAYQLKVGDYAVDLNLENPF